MAKRETKESYKDTREARQESQANYDTAITGSQTEQGRIQAGIDPLRAGLTSQYTTLTDPNSFSRLSYNPISASTGNLSNTLASAKNFALTGGFTPGREASIMENVAGLKEFGRTGGYTPEAIANIKAQALSPIGAYASGTRDELARRRSVQGGYAPGFGAADRQLQRDTARNIADTSLAANVGIQDRINTNRMAGLTGAGGMEMQLQSMISQYRAQGLSIEQATARAIDDLETQASQFNASQQAAVDAQNQQVEQARLSAGLGGLQGFYNTDVGQYQNERDRANALLGGQTQSNLSYLGNQSGLAAQPGIGGNVMGAVGAGLGILPSFWNPAAKVAGAA